MRFFLTGTVSISAGFLGTLDMYYFWPFFFRIKSLTFRTVCSALDIGEVRFLTTKTSMLIANYFSGMQACTNRGNKHNIHD